MTYLLCLKPEELKSLIRFGPNNGSEGKLRAKHISHLLFLKSWSMKSNVSDSRTP